MVREYVKQNINNADGIFTTIVLRINKGDKMATYKGGRKDTGAVGLTTFNKLRYSPWYILYFIFQDNWCSSL